jgi:hypothetical protein
MKSTNTKYLTLQQCIDIIEESTYGKKDRAIDITRKIYKENQRVSSISIDNEECSWALDSDQAFKDKIDALLDDDDLTYIIGSDKKDDDIMDIDGVKNEVNTKPITDKLSEFLGKNGISFFKELLETRGKLSVVIFDGPIPHPVHFREGMQVRNFLRSLEECKEWSDEDFDDKWESLVIKVLDCCSLLEKASQKE